MNQTWQVPNFVYTPADKLPASKVWFAYTSLVGVPNSEAQKVLNTEVRSLASILPAGRVEASALGGSVPSPEWFESRGALNKYREKLLEVMRERAKGMQVFDAQDKTRVVSIRRPGDYVSELNDCRRQAAVRAIEAVGYRFVPASTSAQARA